MMTVPQAHRTEPDETAHELMEAESDDHAATTPLFDGEDDWPGLVNATYVGDESLWWW